MAFSSLYIAYVIVVYVSHKHWKKSVELSCNSSNESDLIVPILSRGRSCTRHSDVIGWYILMMLNTALPHDV
ncbi:unnamed protein product [Malus baccata var. baccata]